MEHENLNTPQNPPLQQTAVRRIASKSFKVGDEEYTFLEVNFRNIEGDDRWTIIKVPMNWDESEIRNSMMNDREITEIYNMFETGCSDDNYSWDFT
jgi:hypothetical protein